MPWLWIKLCDPVPPIIPSHCLVFGLQHQHRAYILRIQAVIYIEKITSRRGFLISLLTGGSVTVSGNLVHLTLIPWKTKRVSSKIVVCRHLSYSTVKNIPTIDPLCHPYQERRDNCRFPCPPGYFSFTLGRISTCSIGRYSTHPHPAQNLTRDMIETLVEGRPSYFGSERAQGYPCAL